MKSGIISFPLEVDLNDKMKLLEAEFGLKGFGVMIKLFQSIYKRGYYMHWNIDVGCLFIREECPEVGWQFVSEIVACAVRRGIFEKDLYEKHSILTSDRIQETYLIATKRRKEVELEEKYLLPIAYTFIKDVDISSKNVYKISKNVCISEQRKGKERKEEERKEECGDKPPRACFFTPPSFKEVEDYCKERKNDVVPKKFYDYFTASGWIDSKGNKVRNWKQKVITWERSDNTKVVQNNSHDRKYSDDELNGLIDDIEDIEI